MQIEARFVESRTPRHFGHMDLIIPDDLSIGDALSLVQAKGSLTVSSDAVYLQGQFMWLLTHLLSQPASAMDLYSSLTSRWFPFLLDEENFSATMYGWEMRETRPLANPLVPKGESYAIEVKTKVSEEPLPTSKGLIGIVEMVEGMRESYPSDMWDDVPTDLAENKKHYLYSLPKETD